MTSDKTGSRLAATTAAVGAGAPTPKIDVPTLADGAGIARIVQDSGTLDVNSSYAYLLWCRDFAETSAVARIPGSGESLESSPAPGGSVVGFVTGYLRPESADTLMVWQIAVDSSQRGRGLAGKLLDYVLNRVRPRFVETTITADNGASIALFESLTRRHPGATIERSSLFSSDLFPDAHEAEDLYRMGPFFPRDAV